MAKQRTSVLITPAAEPKHRIKSVSLRLFRSIRWLGRQGARTPARLSAVGREIAAAWRESAQC